MATFSNNWQQYKIPLHLSYAFYLFVNEHCHSAAVVNELILREAAVKEANPEIDERFVKAQLNAILQRHDCKKIPDSVNLYTPVRVDFGPDPMTPSV